MLKFSSHVLNEDFKTLSKSTPESKKKVKTLATVIFLPVILWLLQGPLLFHSLLKLNIWLSLLIGAFMALLVFLLDRSILAAPKSGSISRTRIIAAFCVAFIGSIVLDEVIFKNDIDNQMTVLQEEEKQAYLEIINSKYEPKLDSFTNVIQQKEFYVRLLEDSLITEMNGKGGSGRYGYGINARTFEKRISIAKADLKVVKKGFEHLQDEYKAEEKDKGKRFDEDYKGHSLITRMRALFHLLIENPISLILYIPVTIFLFILEFIPVLLKLGWKQTAFERQMELTEIYQKNRMEKMLEHDIRFFNSGNGKNLARSIDERIQNNHEPILN